MDGTATHMECVFNTQQYIKSGGLLEGTSYCAYLALELGLVPTLFSPSPRERDLGRPSPENTQNLHQNAIPHARIHHFRYPIPSLKRQRSPIATKSTQRSFDLN